MAENQNSQKSVVSTINTKGALAALAASDSLGLLMLYVIPLVLGSMVEGFGISEGTAGFVTALEFGTMAVAGTLISCNFHKLKVRGLAYIAIALIVAGNILSYFCVTYNLWEAFVTIRGVVGLGSGTLLSLAYGLAAQTRKPLRTFSFLAGSEVVVAMLGAISIGVLVDRIGPEGAFAALGGIALLLLPVFIWFPENGNELHEETSTVRTKFTPDIILLLCAGGFFATALNVVYPFVALIGLEIGIPYATIATILTLSLLLSVLGPVVCNLLWTHSPPHFWGCRYDGSLPCCGLRNHNVLVCWLCNSPEYVDSVFCASF